MNKLKKLLVKPAPLHLDGYFIRKLSFSISEDVERDSLSTLILSNGLHPQLEQPFGEGQPPHFEIGFNVEANADDASEYKCGLRVKSLEKKVSKQPYEFEAEIIAFFSWMPEKKDFSDFEQAVKSTAIGLMYSTIREALASATARSPLPALVLPAAWFRFTDDEAEIPRKIASPRNRQTPSKIKKKSIVKTTKKPKRS